MRTWTKTILCILILLTTVFLSGARPYAENEVKLIDPSDGDVLRGTITIRGNTDVVGFRSYRLEFAYEHGTNDTTWFLIAESNEKIAEGVLATWDTQEVTDGDYRMRLTVTMDDDKPEYDISTELKIRNYTPLRDDETVAETLQPTAEVVAADAEMDTASDKEGGSLWSSMLRGMLYTVLVVVILAAGLWFYTQQNRRNRRQHRR